jgi:hypothetical protein
MSKQQEKEIRIANMCIELAKSISKAIEKQNDRPKRTNNNP